MANRFLHRNVYYMGQAVFREGATGNRMYLVDSGRISLTVTREGQEIEIAEIGPGAIFGEMAVIDGSPRMANAVATTQTVCYVIDRRMLDRKMAKVDDQAQARIWGLLDYVRKTLPFELREDKEKAPNGDDEVAARLISESATGARLRAINPLIGAFFDVLSAYTARRLPPQLRPDKASGAKDETTAESSA